MALPLHVTIVEVGPRDGLQNEPERIATDDKIAFVDLLSAAGLPVIEVSAFVRADWVPQLADSGVVAAKAARRPGTRYSALVPNATGLRYAQAAGLTEVAIFAAASETFSRRNINRGIEESLQSYARVCEDAIGLGLRVRAYLSTAFGCPFEGRVDPADVADIARRLLDMGAFEVAVHFHDTRGTALANVLAALIMGVHTFDASAGGLGGCPYAPGATGNLATEDLLYMLDGLGIQTGVSLPALLEASRFIEPKVGHPLPSRYYRAEIAKRTP
jgi:hydroxymethylglutaryl-CoA lyase